MKKDKGLSHIFVIGAILCVLALLCIMSNSPNNNDTIKPNYAINIDSNINDLENSEDVVEAYKNGNISFEDVMEYRESGILEDSDFEDLIILAFENGDIDELELGEFYEAGDIDLGDIREVNLSSYQIEHMHDSGYLDVDCLKELYEDGDLDRGDILDMRRDGSLDNEEVKDILSYD